MYQQFLKSLIVERERKKKKRLLDKLNYEIENFYFITSIKCERRTGSEVNKQRGGKSMPFFKTRKKKTNSLNKQSKERYWCWCWCQRFRNYQHWSATVEILQIRYQWKKNNTQTINVAISRRGIGIAMLLSFVAA